MDLIFRINLRNDKGGNERDFAQFHLRNSPVMDSRNCRFLLGIPKGICGEFEGMEG